MRYQTKYNLVKYIAKALSLFPFFYSIEVKGESLPEGRVILASNHDSKFDPLAMALSFDRRVHFMFRYKRDNKDGFVGRATRAVLSNIGQIYVDGAPRTAIRKSLRYLEQDEILGFFFKGNLVHDLNHKHVLEYLACSGNSPVVPLAIHVPDYIWPNEPLFPKPYARISLNVGSPISPSKKDLVKQVEAEIERLKQF